MNEKSQQPDDLAGPGIFNHVPVGFVVLDAKGRILAVNQLLEKLLATDRQKLLKHHLSEHVVVTDRQLLAKHLSQLLAVGVAQTCRLRIAKPGGEIVWVRLDSLVTSDEAGQTVIHSVVIDIADHQATEQQLAEKEARLRTVLATIPDMVWLKNPQGVYLNCNKMFERFFGAAASEIIGRTDYDFVDKELADFFRENDYKAMTSGKPSMNEETLIFAADGTQVTVETIKTPAYAADGSLIGVLGVARDITERKRMEAALQLSETRFRQLIQTLPLPLTIINKNGAQEYINDRFIKVFGYTYEDIPTLSDWWKLAYPDVDYRQWAMQSWTTAVEKAAHTGKDIEPIEYNITCKNQLVRPVIVSGVTIGDVVLSTFTDISDRRRHERIMKASYERRRKNELMNEMIQTENPSQQVIFESARVMGANILVPFSCYLVVIDAYQKKDSGYWQKHLTEYHLLLDSVFDALEATERIIWESPDGIGVLVFEPHLGENVVAKQKMQAEQLRIEAVTKSPGLKLTIGVAELAGNMAEFGERYRQARTAVHYGQKVWPQLDTYHYLDLGVYQLLACFNDEKQINEYIERVLGKLLQYDNKRKGEAFLDTLGVLLMSDNMKEGAEKLSIHYQTLLFRKQRLEKILGVSFEDFAMKMSLLTALHLLKIRKK